MRARTSSGLRKMPCRAKRLAMVVLMVQSGDVHDGTSGNLEHGHQPSSASEKKDKAHAVSNAEKRLYDPPASEPTKMGRISSWPFSCMRRAV